MVVVVFVGGAPRFPGALPKQSQVKPRGGQLLEPHRGQMECCKSTPRRTTSRLRGKKKLELYQIHVYCLISLFVSLLGKEQTKGEKVYSTIVLTLT